MIRDPDFQVTENPGFFYAEEDASTITTIVTLEEIRAAGRLERGKPRLSFPAPRREPDRTVPVTSSPELQAFRERLQELRVSQRRQQAWARAGALRRRSLPASPS